MPATTDRTPAQWAELLASKVMGWVHDRETGYWIANGIIRPCPFDPWNNLADSREVLERLALITVPVGTWKRKWRIENNIDGTFTVSLLMTIPHTKIAHAPGPHEGPATCWLAESVLGER